MQEQNHLPPPPPLPPLPRPYHEPWIVGSTCHCAIIALAPHDLFCLPLVTAVYLHGLLFAVGLLPLSHPLWHACWCCMERLQRDRPRAPFQSVHMHSAATMYTLCRLPGISTLETRRDATREVHPVSSLYLWLLSTVSPRLADG